MNLFAIPKDDQSVAILGKIFGHVGAVLPASADSPLILGAMFKTFNTVMLTLGTLVIVYTTIVGLLATAHEGEFMGKKWSGLWVPLRSLIGIVALFPTTTGYSALQVIVMWVVLQGVGAADMLWNTVLNYSLIAGSPISPNAISTIGLDTKIHTIFEGLTCQSSSLYQDKSGGNKFYYCTDRSDDPYCKLSQEDLYNLQKRSTLSTGDGGKTYRYPMGPSDGNNGGLCGVITYCNPEEACKGQTSTTETGAKLKCAMCKTQQAALAQIIPTLGQIAATFTKADSEYVKFARTGNVNVPDWVQTYCTEKLGIKDKKDCCIWKWGQGNLGVSMPVACGAKFPDYRVSEQAWQNPSEDLVKQVYWKFVMEPYLNNSDYTKVSMDYFVSAISGAITTVIASLDPKTLQDNDWRKDAQKNGWITAGTFYNAIANADNNSLEGAQPDFTVIAMLGPNNAMSDYRNNMAAAKTLNSAQVETDASTPSPEMGRLKNDLNGIAHEIMMNWRASMSTGGGDNPLAQLHSFGKRLLITAEVMYPVILAAAVVVGASEISFIALGTGPLNVMAWLKYLVIFGILPAAFAILGICLSFGGMLAVYVPLIPYVVFTLTALGWFISTIEAMVASPLIALGILSPGGQHEILGKSEGALMLLLGVLLRPSLMIFGLMGAMLLSYASLIFVNNTFTRAMSEITRQPSITEMVLFMAAYAFLIIAILNKCFSLIHLVPERVMAWIGGQQGASYGEGEGLGEVKRGAEGAGAGAAGMAKGVGGQVQSALGVRHKRENRDASAS